MKLGDQTPRRRCLVRSSDSGSGASAKYSLSMKNATSGVWAGANSPTEPEASSSQNLLGNKRELWVVEVDIIERKGLEDLLECALTELKPGQSFRFS